MAVVVSLLKRELGVFMDIGLKPHAIDKHGVIYKRQDVDESCLKMIKTETYFCRGAKNMTIDAEKAIELTDDVTERFSKSLDRLTATHQKFSDKSKKASGDVRDAANKLAEGLIKIEKVANFERLERYVELLERAAQAMSVLAELEKNGKLEKIANAIK